MKRRGWEQAGPSLPNRAGEILALDESIQGEIIAFAEGGAFVLRNGRWEPWGHKELANDTSEG